MFNANLLRLMQRIALGLPLALPTLAAPFNYAGCYPLGYSCPETPVSAIVEYASDGEGAVVDCVAACGEGEPHCRAISETQVECISMIVECPAAGRRPGGAIHRTTRSGIDRAPQAQWLFDALAFEAAAIPSFDELALALAHHGAPRQLCDRAREARDDEVRHTEAMATLLARRETQLSVRVSVEKAALPSLYQLCLTNLIEGCTREAFGAFEAALQAERAFDPDVREAMGKIARDEARHAHLAFDIDTWARGELRERGLGDEGQANLDDARADAIAELSQTLQERVTPAALGLVSAAEVPSLFAAG